MLRWPARWRSPDPAAYPAGPLRELAAAPFPRRTTPVSRVDFLAVDIETTGLDSRRDHVVAVGWVPVTGGQVLLGGAKEIVISPPIAVGVGDSATLHGLTDDRLAAAPTLVDALPELLGALRGRVLLAHHTPIELGFLTRATRAAL